MRLRVPRSVKRIGSAAAVLALVLGATAPALANLPGSTFEGNDGNLIVNTAGNTDWANIGIVCPAGPGAGSGCGIDQPSGTTDNSFGQGTKEDSPNVTVVTGSIPPNKSDLIRFYDASEFVGGSTNSNFLYLAWERTNVLGSANMDFEINQSATPGLTSSFTGPITLNRMPGDLLVTYDFTTGGTTPTLGLLVWVTSANGTASDCFSSNTLPCWGKHVSLTSANSEGAINTGTVTDPIAPNAPRSLPGLTFGEAAINLTSAGVFPPSTCKGFGSVFLKSRSSASFTSEVKDFVAPVPVNVSNCGEVKIIKHTDPRGVDQSFSYTSDLKSVNNGVTTNFPTFTLNDKGNTTSDSAGNTLDATNVPAGSYSVTEGSNPANFVFESLVCTAVGAGSSVTPTSSTTLETASITLAPNGLVTCVYTNLQQLGAIKVTKESSKNSGPLSGAMFAISSGGSPITGSPVTTGADGTACLDHLPFGAYSVQETAAPSGYKIDNTSAVSVTVDHNASCTSGTPNAPAIFTDTPLSQITVTFHSLVAGATSATIQCTGEASATALPDGTPHTLGDGISSLVPGTYACTVVIDP